jgi:hypothetical protein
VFLFYRTSVCLELVLLGSMDGTTWPCPAPESDSLVPPFVSNMPDARRLLAARDTNARVGNWSRILNLGVNWFWSNEPRCFVQMQQHIIPQATCCRFIRAYFWLAQIHSVWPIQPYRFIFVLASSSLKRRRVVRRTGVRHGRIANCQTTALHRSSREEGAGGLPLRG